MAYVLKLLHKMALLLQEKQNNYCKQEVFWKHFTYIGTVIIGIEVRLLYKSTSNTGQTICPVLTLLILF